MSATGNELVKLSQLKGTVDAIKDKIDGVEAEIPSIVDNTTSTATDSALSANQGKILQGQINNLKNIGRFLAIWNATTGVPTSNPEISPYDYHTGDYFRIGVVGNRIPTGSQYIIGGTNYTTTTDTLSIGDVYYYDGTSWNRQASSGGGTVQDVQVDGTSVLSGGIASIDLSGKLDKDTVTGVWRVYANKNGTQSFYDVSGGVVGNTLAYRQSDGALKVGTPVANDDATPKSYVDNHHDSTKQDKIIIDANLATITPVENTYYRHKDEGGGGAVATPFVLGQTYNKVYFDTSKTVEEMETILSSLEYEEGAYLYPIVGVTLADEDTVGVMIYNLSALGVAESGYAFFNPTMDTCFFSTDEIQAPSGMISIGWQNLDSDGSYTFEEFSAEYVNNVSFLSASPFESQFIDGVIYLYSDGEFQAVGRTIRWGTIQGTVSDQRDLVQYLDGNYSKTVLINSARTTIIDYDSLPELTAQQIIDAATAFESGANVIINRGDTYNFKVLDASIVPSLIYQIHIICTGMGSQRKLVEYTNTNGTVSVTWNTLETSAIVTELNGKVSDVKINGTSVVSDGVANIPKTTASDVDSGNATNGQVLTANGTGGASWQTAGGGATWGGISGTLSNQTDLQNALNAKADDSAVVHKSGNETIAGTKTFSSQINTQGINYSSKTHFYFGSNIDEIGFQNTALQKQTDVAYGLGCAFKTKQLMANTVYADKLAYKINTSTGNGKVFNLPISKADGTYTLATTDDVTNYHDITKANASDVYTKSETYSKSEIDGITDNIENAINDLDSTKADVDDLPTKTSDLNNDSNFVSDANYVHTDNNYTSAEKTKVANSVQDANYVHTDNNYTNADKSKISGLPTFTYDASTYTLTITP